MHSKIISACIATSCVLAARGCTTQIKNTVVNRNVNLPITVTGVVVIYEPARFGDGTKFLDFQQQTRDKVVAKMGNAVELILPKELQNAGIAAKFAAAHDAKNIERSWHRVIVRPLKDFQTCVGPIGGSCSHRLTFGVRLLEPTSNAILWSSEIEEPYMVSSFVYDARYQELAGHAAKALLTAIKAN